ncbi:ion transporter [Nocardioides sp. SYSU D00038]|uniref:ion transporter n=1 Tax=Nocardioides sp. SYSU D00038 TaxID=2812554 RepID=UPI0019677AF6|nr:ion transporter [Nocardioides sp. SYSU D00038]
MTALRARVRVLVESTWFQGSIIAVILVNAVVLGLEVSPRWMARWGDATSVVGWVTVAIFVVEISLRLFAHGPSFFRGGWNVFDLVVVLIALAPTAGSYSVLRVLRVFRVLRLLSTVRSMRVVVSALITTVPGMASIAALLGIVMYIAAVVSTQLFGGTDPEHFGSLGTSLLSLFQVTTGDDWANVIRPVTDAYPAAWLFFIAFIVVATYIVLNLFIAVAVEALDRESEEDREEIEEAVDESTVKILAAIDDLRRQVSALEARLDGRD